MELDPTIVERYAAHLERRASSRVTLFSIMFALIGSTLGAVPLFPLKYGVIPHHLGLATLLAGAAAGGYLGYTIGMRRAETLRLQAQMTLHQLTFERSFARQAAPVTAAPVAAAPVPVPVPVPVAVAPVAPVAPAPVLPTAPPVLAPSAPPVV